MILSHNIQS